MDRTIAILTLLLTVAGCARGYDPEPPGDLLIPTPNLEIESLHTLYREEPLPIREPLVIGGTVTTSDQEGNFYQTLLIEQEGYAVELLTGVSQLHSSYPIGSRVHLCLEGLTLDRYRGVLQIGRRAPDYAYNPLEGLGSRALLDQHLYWVKMEAEPQAVRYRIEELEERLCGTLVEVEGLRYAPLEEEPAQWSGYHRFVNEEGNELHTYTSDYARFASQPIPNEQITLRGILLHLQSGPHAGFVLKPRQKVDIQPFLE